VTTSQRRTFEAVARPRGTRSTLTAAFVGYDAFISYARSDGTAYARARIEAIERILGTMPRPQRPIPMILRSEIRAALQQKIPVIPVTVQNAAMPQAEDLPDDIRLLARRNGIQLDATRWRTDVERLIRELDRVIKR
jgi:hypothetical protein